MMPYLGIDPDLLQDGELGGDHPGQSGLGHDLQAVCVFGCVCPSSGSSSGSKVEMAV